MKHERLLKLAGTILLVAAGVVIAWRASEEVGTGRAAEGGRALVVESVRGGSGLGMDGNPAAEAGVFKASERVSADRESAAAGKGDVPDSLQEVFIGARHAIQVVTEEERKLPENEGALYFASNPKNQGQVRFLEDGAVRFSAKGETCAVWQGRRMNEVELERLAGPTVSGGEAEFRWSGGISESFENVPEGLRHQIRLRERTEPADGGNLWLGFPLKDSIAQQDPAGDGILISSRNSSDVALHYGVPQVTDSTGRALRASVSARGRQGFSIEVEDRAAVYPLDLGTLAVWKIRDAGLVDPDGRTQRPDSFGRSVALSGDTAVIGAPGDNTALGEYAGSVYVFRRDLKGRWSLVKQLRPPQGGRTDGFGRTVAISGDSLAASAPFSSPDGMPDEGCVWVFKRIGTDWIVDQRITSPAMDSDSSFGNAMALFEDRIIASVPTTVGPGNGTAYAYVRKPEGWELEANLGDLPENQFSFGRNFNGLALSGNLAAVAGDAEAGKPGVFVLRRDSGTWKFETFLPRPESQASSNFGNTLAIAGNLILVGDPEALRKSDGLYTGAVYVYEFNAGQWTLKQEICPDDLHNNNGFGGGIAVSGARAIFRATAGGRFSEELRNGRDFLFALEGGLWVRKAALSYADTQPSIMHARAIAISGDTALLAGAKSTVDYGNRKIVEGVDVVSVIRLTQEITVEVPPLAPFVSGQRLDDPYFFFDLKIGQKATWTFDVRNTGLLPLEGLRTQIQSATPGFFSVKKELPQKIKPGDTAQVRITFAPKKEGVHKATIRIFSNDANERPFELKVKGKAVKEW